MATKKASKAKRAARRATTARSRARRALRGRCVVRFTPGTVELGGIASSLFGDLTGGKDRYVAEFLITEEQQRVTYGAGDAAITVVHRGGDGMLFWDQRTRTVAEVPSDLLPRTRVAPSALLEVGSRSTPRATTFVLTMRDDGVGAVRHEITVSRNEEWAPFGPALMRILHCGPMCHAGSGLPWAAIAASGVIIRERAFLDGAARPTSELAIDGLEIVTVGARDFSAPAGYRSLDEVMGSMSSAPPRPAPQPADVPTPTEQQAAAVKQALESESGVLRSALRINQQLTPDCLGSTRFGSVTATLHQDALTVAANAINLIAPLIGPTTIAGGTWTIPWLTNLTGLGATAPGSGIRCFLREPRVPASPPGPAGGGRGLLDRLAFMALYELDASGLMRTQREFASGILGTTLATWGAAPGVPAAAFGIASAALTTAGGDLNAISLVDQRVLTDAYEVAELGTISIAGLPARVPAPPAPPFFSFGSLTVGSTTTPPLFILGVTGITGTVNFASLGGGPLITAATIGSAGNIVLGIAFPTTTLTATIIRAVTAWGGFILSVGTLFFCLAFPLLCPLIATLVALAAFVLTNVTTVTATAVGVTWTVDVRFDFDPSTERVEPFVSLVARTGAVTVGTFGSTPNIIANAVDSLIAALVNLFDGWGAALALIATAEIQKLLRANGLQLPVAGRQNELRAIGGGAQSSPGSILQLEADIQPIGNIASEPFTTQVNTRQLMRQQLLVAHLNMRRDLNPQPTMPPPPGPGPAITVGTFAGLGLSQNALNYYVFAQWLQRRFEVTITDPATIGNFMGAAPGLFVRRPVQIHLWPAVAPRIEIAPNELARGTRPLVLFFDDVRACFEVPNPQGVDGTSTFIGLWELSCNFRTTATIDLAWPWVFSLRMDQARASSAPLEPRSWEFVDPNVPAIMATVAPSDLAKLVDLIAAAMLAPHTGQGAGPAVNPGNWARPLPAMQQLIFPAFTPPAGVALGVQQAYIELLSRRKALYALTAIETALLELVDGSGSPRMNGWLTAFGAPGPLPTTLGTMTCPQGVTLRGLLAFPPAGP